MQGMSEERKIYNIKKIVKVNDTIVSSIMTVHALSGCDTVTTYYGIGKITITKKLREISTNLPTYLIGSLPNSPVLRYGYKSPDFKKNTFNVWNGWF